MVSLPADDAILLLHIHRQGLAGEQRQEALAQSLSTAPGHTMQDSGSGLERLTARKWIPVDPPHTITWRVDAAHGGYGSAKKPV